MIQLGNTGIGKLYLGSTEISKAYLGSSLVYDNSGSVPALPYDELLDWAQSDTSGAQIDSGIVINDNNFEVDCRFIVYQKGSNTYIQPFAAYESSTANGFRILWRVSDNWTGIYANSTTYYALSPYLAVNTWYTIVMNYSSIKVNGTTKSITTHASGTTNTATLKFHNSNAKIRFEYMKIKHNGTLVADMQPAKKDDVVGYYDSVTNTFITPTSGSLTGGNNT